MAAVLDGDDVVRGTAFFVGPDVALTCVHVLDAVTAGTARLKRVGSSQAEPIVESDRDEEHDLALLRLTAPPGDAKWLALGPADDLTGRDVSSHGFPRDKSLATFPDGHPLSSSTVTGSVTVNWQGLSLHLLVLDKAAAGKGMSGAPAIDPDTHAVLGVLRFTDKSTEDAYAIPARMATRRWPGLPTSAEQPPAGYAQLAASSDPIAGRPWKSFDPCRLHCVVVGSEGSAAKGADASLGALVEEMLASEGRVALWRAFASACGGGPLLQDAQAREFDADYNPKHVSVAAFGVREAFTTPKSLETATRLLVEADLAFFDTTGFEPGVMLLLGLRGATRRGVTITSVGGGWTEGKELPRPFNLSDLSLSSHTRVGDAEVGEDPRIARLAARARTGFEQLARHPHYLDLPVYDALRQLGSEESAWLSIPVEEEVLVLCSYDPKYAQTWRALRGQLKTALSEAGTSKVVRLQDLPTPQLVSQSLYERVRRCAGCVADWTRGSPSMFFELGVRLAVSPWNAVQIVSADWLSQASESSGQIADMQTLFDPMTYSGATDLTIGTRVAERLLQVRDESRGRGGHPIRRTAAAALARTERHLPDPSEDLRDIADTLSYPGKQNVPQALFYEVSEIKADQERAALERRLAAWLYLEHRLKAGTLPAGDERKERWHQLGTLVAEGLYASDSEEDQELAEMITGRIS